MENWAQSLSFVAIDLETTGLNPYRHEIIEIGATAFSLDALGESFSVLIRPEKKMDPKSRAIHQISSEELEQNAVSLEEGIALFMQFLPEGSWVFHNAPFDLAFLKQSFKQTKTPWPQRMYYDHLQLSRKLRPERESHSLAAIKKEVGIDTGKAHRALADAQATALAFIHLLQTEPDIFSSKTKFQKIRRWQRKTEKFEILFPKNYDQIEQYFAGKIRQESMIKVDFFDRAGLPQKSFIQPKEIMIFSQNVYIRSVVHPSRQEILIPLNRAVFHDQELGAVNFVK
ncbi:MAG TPA: 3'-5' exonuclease [Turneriella sp.]|nr:3'-5' exonuclease [Turneriella sp.]